MPAKPARWLVSAASPNPGLRPIVMPWSPRHLLAFIAPFALTVALCAADPLVLNFYPGPPPGDRKTLPPEDDQTKDTDPLVAGRRIVKLGNVTTPQLAVYRPAKEKDTGASVFICPGGGFSILAYDLEGTEVAAWLNSLGVTGIVLKYRVPARDP